MARIAPAVACAAMIAALAGCGSSSPPPAAGGTPSAGPSAHQAAAQTCKQQFETWKASGVQTIVNGPLKTDLRKVEAAGSDEDLVTLKSGLVAVGKDAARLAAYPMPNCADPKGYWGKMLGLLKAAGDNVSTGSGLGALILAEAPLQKIPAVQAKLSAELKKAAGASKV
jgi:hypothetical protein